MNFQKRTDQRGSISLRALAGIAAIFLPLVLLGADPGWWAERGVKTSGANPSDYAAVNQGQVKNIASAACDELNASLPGGAGDAVNTMISAWRAVASGTSQVSASSVNDYAAINLGQLKNIAKPFYDRLIEIGYTDHYPWLSDSNAVANDYAMANIGQVKQLFAFDIVTDADHDGIPDSWEQYWSEQLGITVTPGGIDPASGLTFLQEFLSGHTPGTSVATGPASAVALEVYTPLR